MFSTYHPLHPPLVSFSSYVGCNVRTGECEHQNTRKAIQYKVQRTLYKMLSADSFLRIVYPIAAMVTMSAADTL